MRYLSADVGGTFTDLVLIDSDGGALNLDKAPRRPNNRFIPGWAARAGLETKGALRDPARLAKQANLINVASGGGYEPAN